MSETLRAGYMSPNPCRSDGNKSLSKDSEDSVDSDGRYELPRAPKKRVGPSTF
jgi:hypothetical protein